MRRAHPDDPSEGVNVKCDLFDVRRVQLRKLSEVTSELACEFDDCLLGFGQTL